MPQAAVVPTAERNPPVDYAVAVWLGTPKDGLEKGLREGWIRAPGVDLRAWAEERQGVPITSPPAPDEGTDALSSESTSLDARTRIETILRRLDPALEARTFADAWNEAGSDEATRARRFVDFLGRVLNVPQDNASDPVSRLASLEETADGMQTTARFMRLDGMTGRELERLASAEGGVRRALAEHSPWAFTGDRQLARLSDASGRYDRFDPDSGEALLSDAWLGDRARHAAWRNAAAAGRPLEVDGDGWRFVDRAAGDAVSVELRGAADHPVHQVIFARDGGDRVNGGVATDRIHGARGDDILRGRAGDDLLEGGAGDDALHGGSGRDLLAGQQGDDELDGGAGDDRLDGGSGDDELSGGRGDDLLRGGAGEDTYRFDGGDGADTIEDDGGVVIVDDITITGTMRRNGDGWVSADGRFQFALEGEGDDGGTLVIRADGESAEGLGQSAVRIAAWKPGSFGITLAGADEAEGDHDEARADGSGGQREQGAREGEADPDDDPPEGAADAFSPPELQQSDSGGPGGEADPGSGTSAAMALPSTLSTASWLLNDAFEALSFVDTQSLARALETWSPPAPPDVGFVADSPVGVTSVEIGDALAEAAGDAESDGGAGSIALDPWSALSPPRLLEGGLKSPPDLVLRQVS